ncbi:MAG: PKD domain-containing protein, partial [Patescibacteria group bacterium]
KKLLKLSVILVLLIFVSASSVMASGKMEVNMGDKVTLQADEITGGTFKWVAKKGKEIITTQGTSIFNYTFNEQGEYDVILTITDAAGDSKKTTIKVLVGDRYSALEATGLAEGGQIGVPLSVGLETLPIKTSQRSVHILGDEGRVVFDIGVQDDILEYRIDRNIFVDSDGNGIANDDIDNADHSSYLLGGVWQTKYLASESNKIVAEVTVVNKQGQKVKTQAEIIFEPVPGKEGNVVAVLDTLPVLDPEDKKIYVYDALDTVAFYSRRSQGDIIEHRIDKNIFVDSDGDGNPANDIDNRTDNSFKTGDVWVTAYEKTDDQIIAQLIVVSKGGSGSRIQREIKFTERLVITVSEVTEAESPIQLKADKEFVQKGDPINFTVEGLVQDLSSYIFDWDFNGDGEVDQTVEGDNTVSYIYDTPGIQLAKVRVQDDAGNEANFSLDVLVKDTAVTTADFEYTAEEGKVTFNNLSVVSPNLTSKALSYTWSFGDTDPASYEAQKDQIGVQNPTYTYTKNGNYVVTLTVVDADQVSNTKTQEVVIEGIAAEEGVPAGAGEEAKAPGTGEGGSIIWAIVKVIFYIILAVILLVLLIVVGLLAFLKIQHPDLVFEELIDELRIKILGMIGVHEMIEPGTQPEAVPPQKTIPEKPVQAKPAPAEEPAEEINEEPEPEAPAKEPPLAKAEGPVPDWLKSTTPAAVTPTKPDVIEGEVEEEPAEEAPAKSSAEPAKKDEGPVPDWLKNA